MYKTCGAFRLQFSTLFLAKILLTQLLMICSYKVVLIPKLFVRKFLSSSTGFKTGTISQEANMILAASFSANFFLSDPWHKKIICSLFLIKINVASIIIFITAVTIMMLFFIQC